MFWRSSTQLVFVCSVVFPFVLINVLCICRLCFRFCFLNSVCIFETLNGRPKWSFQIVIVNYVVIRWRCFGDVFWCCVGDLVTNPNSTMGQFSTIRSEGDRWGWQPRGKHGEQ